MLYLAEEEKVIELPEDVCPDPEVEEEDDDDLILPSLEPPRRKPKKAENVPQSVIEVKESEDELMVGETFIGLCVRKVCKCVTAI